MWVPGPPLHRSLVGSRGGLAEAWAEETGLRCGLPALGFLMRRWLSSGGEAALESTVTGPEQPLTSATCPSRLVQPLVQEAGMICPPFKSEETDAH